MPFIPHTESDVQAMLQTIGVQDIAALFAEIPADLQAPLAESLPAALNEMTLLRLLQGRAREDEGKLCFIGAGAYEHHIPAAVWDIAGRGEWMTAYTPYQAEASQGSLQLIYEYQSMMTQLTALDVSNASLYDGATALAEAILMAVRGNRKSRSKRILLPATLHPAYRETAQTIVASQGIELVSVPYTAEGRVDQQALDHYAGEDWAALVVPQPNFFGVLDEVDTLTDWGHQQGALVIAVVNPMSLALLTPPGEWGAKGADIACGEGQPLGVPLSGGGPYFGFMCCRQALVRQLPGRLIGRTLDLEGKVGYTLTLQAREQHIRRAKATSNICTNQGLMVTAATIYMSLLGAEGLRQVALTSHQNTQDLLTQLSQLPGVESVFSGPSFHEGVIRLPGDAQRLAEAMAQRGILPGVSLGRFYPELTDCWLLCATETKTPEDIALYVATLAEVLGESYE